MLQMGKSCEISVAHKGQHESQTYISLIYSGVLMIFCPRRLRNERGRMTLLKRHLFLIDIFKE